MRIKKYIIPTIVLAILIALFGWWSFNYGKRITIKEYESVVLDSTIMSRVDSLFNVMLVRLDTSSIKRETIYKNTETIYKKIIESYEKADTMRPHTDGNVLLESLTRISNTKF